MAWGQSGTTALLPPPPGLPASPAPPTPRQLGEFSGFSSRVVLAADIQLRPCAPVVYLL